MEPEIDSLYRRRNFLCPGTSLAYFIQKKTSLCNCQWALQVQYIFAEVIVLYFLHGLSGYRSEIINIIKIRDYKVYGVLLILCETVIKYKFQFIIIFSVSLKI